MDKIPTRNFAERQIEAFDRTRAKIQSLQMSISTGKIVQKPSDAPILSSWISRLENDIHIATQKRHAYDIADIDLALEGSSLEKVNNVIIRMKELALQINGGVYNESDRDLVAVEVSELRDGMLDMANIKNAQGQYLYGGLNGDSKPFVYQDGKVRFDGTGESGVIEVVGGRRLSTSDSGNDVFMSVPLSEGERDSAFTVVGNFISVLQGDYDAVSINIDNVDPSSQKDLFPHYMERIIADLDAVLTHTTRYEARAGARQNVIIHQREALDERTLDYQSRISALADADIAELASELTHEKNTMEAAYMSFSKIIAISLFDYIK